MDLQLSTDDATILYELLQAHLPELRREVARTENRQYRHRMEQRQELCERLIARLVDEGVSPISTFSGPTIASPV